MRSFYYELAENQIGKHFRFGKPITSRYFVKHTVGQVSPHEAMYLSERVWEEAESGSVTFIKNRHSPPSKTEVDMKEFMWVKLASLEI